ncbi:hypothetical protein [Xanthomonas indica]|uniref:Energy-coupling factor transport system substrate-specific component n=1 Tax=Xanthomonas indica TaxID=2912242 RepID=A0AAU8I493_9XANT|nr:hypothetical protein [Xanthomonas indica]MCI2263402.1 hypothetical protein [Xanthomonas indica]
MNKNIKLILAGVFLSFFNFLIIKLAFLGPFRPFIRDNSMQTTYMVTFALISLILPICIEKLKGKFAAFAGGAALGYLASFISLIVAVVESSGYEMFFATASRFGWINHVLFHMFISLLLCGWLLGIVATLVTNKFRTERSIKI